MLANWGFDKLSMGNIIPAITTAWRGNQKRKLYQCLLLIITSSIILQSEYCVTILTNSIQGKVPEKKWTQIKAEDAFLPQVNH